MNYTTLLCCLFTVFSLTSASAADKKTNILYVYVDDMGWGSIGPNGQAQRKADGKPYVLTPNLDRLAAQGVNFQRAYGCTVCSPARSSQQTGFHQGYTFADRNDPDNNKKAIRADDVTMGDVLSKAGYVTGYWGKWGYGGSQEQVKPTLGNLQTLPTAHGYQYVVAELHHVRAHTFFQPTLWTAPAAPGTKGGLELKANSMDKYKNNKAYPNYPALQNNPNYPEVAYCDDVYAFAALDFVRQQAMNYNKTGQPFFGLFAAQIPHGPFDDVATLPNWNEQYKNQPYFSGLAKQSQQWCSMVTRIDAHIGNLLAALEDPNGDGDTSDSVAHNTLVIFQSDNGGPGGSTIKDLQANGGLSGTKGGIMEGGIRVPTIMRWPAKITASSKLKAGTSTDQVIDCTHMLPHFCDLAGVPTPLGLSGVSLAPTLTGSAGQRQRDYLIHEAGRSASIIRGRYKFIRTRSQSTKRKISKKQRNKRVNSAKLFDLNTDPAERNNIAKAHPQLVKELNELLTGERVDEAAGFANTYHHWLGAKGSSIAAAANWSDYVYENAGVKYTTENGAPQDYWTAKLANGAEALADKSVSFLGLEIGGGKKNQLLTVNAGVVVSGRNEIRVAAQGRALLKGGSLTSLRWVDVQAGGTLQGYGTIATDLYTQGTLALSLQKSLWVKGTAVLAGKLTVMKAVSLKKGESVVILQAQALSGSFTNTEVLLAGKSYKISYSKTSVSLTAQ
ncbi:MAG: sulfatase-like hydrolase/transferase [Lentisphaeraceae bacterium]|nr:sulfatase-like hydrolase/transferase [Lentisphaeraceae bacterium]